LPPLTPGLMKYFSIILIGLMLAVWLFGAVKEFRSASKDRSWWKFVRMIAATFMGIGALGFFGTALVAIGGFRQLPASFEWPVGHSKGVVSTKDNHFVVPHTPSGRVQVYDRNWKFLRGWNVDAGAGTFTLHISDTNHINVVTARRQMHYVYDLHGKLLSSENYSVAGSRYGSFPNVGESYFVPTSFWLLVFTSPFYSWLMIAAGFGLFFLQHKMRRTDQPKKLPLTLQ
jgi:hypothetical protein